MARAPFYSASPRQPMTPTDPELQRARPRFRRRVRRFYARFERLILVGGGFLCAGLAVLVYSIARPAPRALTPEEFDQAVVETLSNLPEEPSVASVAYQIIGPSVVRVSRYSDDDDTDEAAVGTGVIIDEIGIILTSLHVVAGPDRIVVTFMDGFETAAEIIMAQPENDIAAIQVEITPEGLVPATLTSTRGLNRGDTVVAVGHPFGIGNSVSAGVVSGLNRTYTPDGDETPFSGLIQFDAAANPGNSGGPLVNSRGEVLGIVSSILNPTNDGVFIGIGFAVPIETAARAGGRNPF